MEAFIGTILPVGFDYAPAGWAFCNGQLLAISSNSALFALLGTTYGGDGITNFGLPDLRGRTIVGAQAQGPGLQFVNRGDKAGVNATTVVSTGSAMISLSPNQLPPHTHGVTVPGGSFTATSTLKASPDTSGGNAAQAGATLCSTATGQGQAAIYQTGTPSALNSMSSSSITTTIGGEATVTTAPTGSGQPVSAPVSVNSPNVSVMQPFLGVNYIICLEGLFPPRS